MAFQLLRPTGSAKSGFSWRKSRAKIGGVPDTSVGNPFQGAPNLNRCRKVQGMGQKPHPHTFVDRTSPFWFLPKL